MSKTASTYICQACGAQTRQFFGRCSNCGEWNSILEQPSTDESGKRNRKYETFLKASKPKAMPIDSISEEVINRIKSGYQEFDRVLGGGLVPGSLVLIGGDPGIGKSTLLLQSASSIAQHNSVLYVSAEESAHQVQLRWKRLKSCETNLQLLAEIDLENILEELTNIQPDVAIIDSVQALNDPNLSSAPGSVAQVRECSAALQRIAKQNNIALLLVGHVTKEGILAGPKVLEHLVDAVLTFEGDRFASHRLLRATKNRYGATHELGVFEMQGQGLAEVSNPSELFLSGDSACGISTIVSFEGSRSVAVDLQALISSTTYPSPRRTATGIETNRLHQILAVLEKHVNLSLSKFDCYLAVAGGLNVEEPAADLGIAVAIVSSYKNLKIPSNTVLIGELGLGGQLRPVGHITQRLEEALRLGFKRAVIPHSSGVTSKGNIMNLKIMEASTIHEALRMALEQGM